MGQTAPPAVFHSTALGDPIPGQVSVAAIKTAIAYFDAELRRVLEDQHAAQKKYGSSPSCQRFTAQLTREYFRLCAKRDAWQACLNAVPVPFSLTTSIHYATGGNA